VSAGRRPDPGSVAASAVSAVFGSATRASGDLLECDAALRAVVLRCRRFAFARLTHRADPAPVAAYVAALFAARRPGRVLAVDASGGAPAAVPPTAPGVDVVVINWGLRHWRDLPDVIAASHALCLVVGAEPGAAEVAADVATALSAAVPVLVAVDGRPRLRDTLRRHLVDPLSTPTLVVRPDRHADHVRLAAALMRAAHTPPSAYRSEP
jgi:hypothetical protein